GLRRRDGRRPRRGAPHLAARRGAPPPHGRRRARRRPRPLVRRGVVGPRGRPRRRGALVNVCAGPKTLVVRLPNPAGDVVMRTPVLRALRRALPATRIVWAAKPTGLALLEGLQDRDEVAPIDGKTGRGVLGPWRVGRAWRALEPDAVLL